MPARSVRGRRALRDGRAVGHDRPRLRVFHDDFRRPGRRALIVAVKVTVTVTMGKRTVPLEQVTDRRISTAFESAAREVGTKLDRVRCAKHKQPPTNVRVHFDASGAADLRYDSCCDELGRAVTKVLG